VSPADRNERNEEGVVAASKPGEITTTRVFIRAENVPEEPK
jgi:hypothetical protein